MEHIQSCQDNVQKSNSHILFNGKIQELHIENRKKISKADITHVTLLWFLLFQGTKVPPMKVLGVRKYDPMTRRSIWNNSTTTSDIIFTFLLAPPNAWTGLLLYSPSKLYIT